jgi:hypothetical protein
MSGLLRSKLWVGGDEDGQPLSPGRGRAGYLRGPADSHEPVGVVLLGLLKYSTRWLPELFFVLREDSARGRRFAATHHVLCWCGCLRCLLERWLRPGSGGGWMRTVGMALR